MAVIPAHFFLLLFIGVVFALEDEAMPDFTSGVVVSTAGHTESIDFEATKQPDSEEVMKKKADSLPEISPLAAEIAKLDVDDYPEPVESSKPDDVDNEAIQALVDQFLNKGTLNEVSKEKQNKEAQKLVNSSSYWNIDDLAEKNSVEDRERIIEWLTGYLPELEKVLHQVALGGWNYFTSASPISKTNLDEAEEVARAFLKASARQAAQFNLKALSDDADRVEHFQMELITKEGMNALDAADLENYHSVLSSINHFYASSSICDASATKTAPCILKFIDLLPLLQGTKNASESLTWWTSWRSTVGANLTDQYTHLVKLSNKAAKLNGYANIGEMWRNAYEANTANFNLTKQIDHCYEQIRPFYQQLHAYFRPRLAAIYGADESAVTKQGPLPIHLLKSLNGEHWANHYEPTKPFADEDTLPETPTTPSAMDTSATERPMNGGGHFDEMEMAKSIADRILDNFHAQNVTTRTMFIKVYRYMRYLGFDKLPKSLWSKSVFSRNWSKDMICSPSTAYDMVSGADEDYRIKICAQLGEADFVNAHRLMAQLYYKYLSRKQSLLLRDSPNPSLGAALSGAFGILATNVDYLKAMKMLDDGMEYTEPYIINRLYREALEQFVALPFSVVADRWRAAVFEGRLKKANWSEEWWTLREHYQGIRAPTPPLNGRLITDEPPATGGSISAATFSSAIASDAVASPAISQQHAPAVRQFVAYIFQFQILKRLCPDAKALSQGCVPDREAIRTLKAVMAKGASISWVDAMEQLTGSRKLDATPLLEYYEPLISWLENSNRHANLSVGWMEAAGGGQLFEKNELPTLRTNPGDDDQKPFVPGDDQIAYPGASCSNGQECLLDSVCNGTVCVCREGLFTLQIADTYNCVPGDPANAGFTDGKGGLLIALNPNNNTANETMLDGSDHEHSDHADHDHQHADGHDNDDGDNRLDHPASGAIDVNSGYLVMAALMAMVVVVCSTNVVA